MQAGRRPERRNRKIGTAAAGRSQSNRMVVPEPSNDRRHFYERLGPHATIDCRLFGRDVVMLVEEARAGSAFGCSPYDVLLVLSRLPSDDVRGLDLIVFRQPTRKQEILRPVWGRCVFDADFGSHRGAAIIVDAIDLTKPLRWPTKLSLEDGAELERLIEDGHEAKRGRRATTLRPNEKSVRNTILYRTLLHEVGHWQDWRKRVLEPARMSNGKELQNLEKAYLARPLSEREELAHRYAAVQRERLRAGGIIPFDPI